MKRFFITAAIALIALALISSQLNPDGGESPVLIDHSGNESPLAQLSSSMDEELRGDLDHAMSDSEISERSANAAAAVSPAVVIVHREGDDGQLEAIGSGISISESGHILASLRTTGDGGTVKVRWPSGVTVDARIVRIDPLYQLVMLQAEGTAEASAPLAPYLPRSGDRILAIGSPLEDFTSTVTGGIVGAVGVTLPGTIGESEIPNLIQHDAAVNEGNQGGPIVDLNGNVVGINVGSVVRNGDELVQGWGFAVPIAVLNELLSEID
jgi:S1-C subfamily serine protease